MNRPVYTSDESGGRDLRKKGGSGKKKAATPKPRMDGRVRIRLEKAGRKGKGVSIIEGLPAGTQLDKLCKELKGACGTGGTVKNGVIEIQGDQRDRLVDILNRRGFEAKRSG